MKRVLVIYYSQSGDVRSALESVARPLVGPEFEITWLPIGTVPAYPFPWTVRTFFNCMPEAINGEPPPLAPIDLDPAERFDLILIGWQVWFLSPSLPIQAFFASPQAKVLQGTPVISVTCCRQMWQRANSRFRTLVAQAGGHLTDSIVVTHQGSPVAGYLTAPRLMLTGKRDKGRILPASGVAGTEIDGLARFGRRLHERADVWAAVPPVPLLTGLEAAKVPVGALMPEAVGVAFMTVLARTAQRSGPPGSAARQPVIWLFVALLVLLLPIVLAISVILTPLLRRAFSGRLNRYLASVQGDAQFDLSSP